jgi:hypothetical protein
VYLSGRCLCMLSIVKMLVESGRAKGRGYGFEVRGAFPE